MSNLLAFGAFLLVFLQFYRRTAFDVGLPLCFANSEEEEELATTHKKTLLPISQSIKLDRGPCGVSCEIEDIFHPDACDVTLCDCEPNTDNQLECMALGSITNPDPQCSGSCDGDQNDPGACNLEVCACEHYNYDTNKVECDVWLG